ncbi:MAG: hypothetical protein M1814_004100 [Vezdaea aestivalis]|nr:MAG: hypothetical protein M1814_004100 [Vezdaea aestivalis]
MAIQSSSSATEAYSTTLASLSVTDSVTAIYQVVLYYYANAPRGYGAFSTSSTLIGSIGPSVTRQVNTTFTSIRTDTVSSTASASPIASSNIATGTKAAVGVLVPLFVLALALCGFLFVRNRKMKSLTHNNHDGSSGSSGMMTEKSGTAIPHSHSTITPMPAPISSQAHAHTSYHAQSPTQQAPYSTPQAFQPHSFNGRPGSFTSTAVEVPGDHRTGAMPGHGQTDAGTTYNPSRQEEERRNSERYDAAFRPHLGLPGHGQGQTPGGSTSNLAH